MKQKFTYLIIAALLTLFSTAAWSFDLSGEWTLKIENLDHKPVASLKVRFTQEAAVSCLAGSWRRVDVASPTTTNESFFPVTDPLSYQIENSTLTIGRNQVCDAYLHLDGSINELPIHGDYVEFGITGGSKKGYFSLTRNK